MRDMIDLTNAFGQADDGFKDNVHRTLTKLQKAEQRKPGRKMSVRLAVAIAVIACMAVTTTVLAMTNTWGILDFISGRGIEVLPEASEMIKKDIQQEGGQSEFATFTIREAIFDGRNVYIVVEGKPSDPEYLLMGLDANLSDPIGNMGPLFMGQNGTIADYAAENGQKPIRVSIHDEAVEQGAPIIESLDFLLEADGTLVYMLQGTYSGDAESLEMNLVCTITPYEGETFDLESQRRATLSCVMEASTVDNTVTSVGSQVYADCGVRVDKVTLTGSAMAMYVEIEFTVIDEEKYAQTDHGLWFEFLDKNGERLPGGAKSVGSVGAIDDSETRFIQQDSLQASETLPNEIVLRGYNCWEKNRYETHTFEMK